MEMSNKTTIGAFVLGGFILIMGVIIFFGNFNLFSAPFRAAVVFQDSISGLSIGAPVNFRGVRVGTVESISIKYNRKTHTAYIPVIIQLDPKKVTVTNKDRQNAPVEFTRLVALGLRAELNLQSFVTGQSQINLDFQRGSPMTLHPEVTDLPEIPTTPSAIEVMTKQLSKLPLQEISNNLVESLRSIKSLSAKLDAELPDLIKSFKGTSEEAHKAIAQTQGTITEVSKRLDTTLVNVSKMAKDSDAQINSRGQELRTLLLTSNTTILNAQEALKNIKDITSPRSPTRMNLNAGLNDLAATAASLRGFANEIERNPQLLLMGRRQ